MIHFRSKKQNLCRVWPNTNFVLFLSVDLGTLPDSMDNLLWNYRFDFHDYQGFQLQTAPYV